MDHTGHPDETARLVALGRDREAARRYAPDPSPSPHPVGGIVDTNEQLDAIFASLVEIGGNVTPDQLDNATPCKDFDVRGVLGHMIGGARFFGAQFRGEPAPEPPAPGTDLTGDDPVATFTAAMEELQAAVQTPGAYDRVIVAPFGEVPGAFIAQYLTLDGMVHSYDLASATGQTYAPSEELAAEVLAFATQAIAPEMRDGDTFAAEVTPPAGASSLERLVAFTGRTV
jgi:uncharacterized protein (TIGR03086 family)